MSKPYWIHGDPQTQSIREIRTYFKRPDLFIYPEDRKKALEALDAIERRKKSFEKLIKRSQNPSRKLSLRDANIAMPVGFVRLKRNEHGEYKVRRPDWSDDKTYYTSDPRDAVHTAKDMVRRGRNPMRAYNPRKANKYSEDQAYLIVQEGPQPFHDRTTLKNFLSLARHYRNNAKSFGSAILWSGVIAEYEKALGMDISPSGISERHAGGAIRELPIGKIVRGKVGSKKTRGHNPALYGTGRRRLAPNPELLLIGNPHEGCGNPSCKVCRHTRRSNGMKRHRSRNSRRRSRNYPLYVRYGGKKMRRAAALKKLQFRFKKSGKARTLKSAYRLAKGAVNRLHTYHGKKQRIRLGGGKRVTKAMRAAGKRLGRMSRKVAKMVKSGKYTRKQAFKKLAKKK